MKDENTWNTICPVCGSPIRPEMALVDLAPVRFGIGEKSDHTLEEVGQDFEVTRERIRQIEAKALRKLRHPSRSKPTTQPCWTFGEVKLILEALRDDPYFAIYFLLAQTALRIGEAKNLAWDDVDFDSGVLHVRGKVIDKATGEAWRPKSGDQRAVPLSEAVVALLRSLPRRSRWVFASPSRQPRLAGTRTVQKVVSRAKCIGANVYCKAADRRIVACAALALRSAELNRAGGQRRRIGQFARKNRSHRARQAATRS